MRRVAVLIAVGSICVAGGAASAQGVWQPAVLEPGLSAAGFDDFQPSITQDLKTIYFASARPGGLGGMDVWTATRANVSSPWSAPTNVAELNTPSGEFYLSVRGDNLEIILSSNRSGGMGNDDLYRSTRALTTDPWGAPVNLMMLNTPSFEDDPSLTDDGLVLYYTVGPVFPYFAMGGAGIARATRASTSVSFSTAGTVVIDTTGADHSPASADGISPGVEFPDRALIYSSDVAGGVGSSDFYIVERPGPGMLFGAPTNLSDFNTTGWDFNGDESADGRNFYWSQYSMPATFTDADIYRSDRNEPVVFKSAGNLQSPSVTVYARRDPGDPLFWWISVASIPPTPIPGVQGFLGVPPDIFVGTGIGDANGTVTVTVPVPAGIGPGVLVPVQAAGVDPTQIPPFVLSRPGEID